jgi:hypothetical protein
LMNKAIPANALRRTNMALGTIPSLLSLWT